MMDPWQIRNALCGIAPDLLPLLQDAENTRYAPATNEAAAFIPLHAVTIFALLSLIVTQNARIDALETMLNTR